MFSMESRARKRISGGVIQRVFVWVLQGNQVAAQLRSEGGGAACHPAKFKELGLSLCRGQTALHLASLRAHQEKKKGGDKGSF